MSPRQRFFLVMFLVIAIGFSIGIVMGETQSIWAIAAFLLVPFVGTFVLYKIRYPVCGTSLSYKGKIGGLSLYAGYANRKCQKCGHDLTKK